jgi:hypothetical protein
MILAGTDQVLIEDDIEWPMQTVLDRPMLAHDGQQLGRHESGPAWTPQEGLLAGSMRRRDRATGPV